MQACKQSKASQIAHQGQEYGPLRGRWDQLADGTRIQDIHGSIREVGGFTQICLGKSVEERGLADVGQTDNTDLSIESISILFLISHSTT